MDELLSLLDKFSERNPGPWRSVARQVWTALGRAVDRSVAADALPDNELLIRVWRLIADQKFKRGLDAYYCTYREITLDTDRIQNNLLLLLASAATAGECNRALSQNGSASTSNWNTATYTVPDFLRAEYDNRFDIKARPTLRHWTMHWLGETSRPDHSVTVPAVAVTNQGCLCDFVFERCEAPNAGLVEDPTLALRPFSKALLGLVNGQYSKRAPGLHVVWKFEFRPDQRAGPETPIDGDSFGAGVAAGLELLASGRRFDTRSILTASVKPNDGLTSVFLIDKKLAAIPRSHRVGLAHNQPKGEVGSFEQTLEIHRLATVQDAVAFALGSPVPGMGRQTAKLKRYLVGKNPRARAEAAEAAAKAGEVEFLNDALCHGSEEVRIAAAEAVCRFKVAAALPCLVSGLRGNGKRVETALIPGLASESHEPRSPDKNWIWLFGQQAIGPLVDEILRKHINPAERARFATAMAGCLNSISASQLLTDERLFQAEPPAMCVLEAALRSGVELTSTDIQPRLAAISCDAAHLVNYDTAYPARASAWLLESSIRNEPWVHNIVNGWLRTVCTRRGSGNFFAEDLLFRSVFEMGAISRQDLLDLANEIDQFPLEKGRIPRAHKLRAIAGGDPISTNSVGPNLDSLLGSLTPEGLRLGIESGLVIANASTIRLDETFLTRVCKLSQSWAEGIEPAEGLGELAAKAAVEQILNTRKHSAFAPEGYHELLPQLAREVGKFIIDTAARVKVLTINDESAAINQSLLDEVVKSIGIHGTDGIRSEQDVRPVVIAQFLDAVRARMLLYDSSALPYAYPIVMAVFKMFEDSSAYTELKNIARTFKTNIGSTPVDARQTSHAYLELWVSNETTELRVYHSGEAASDTSGGGLIDRYTTIFEGKSSLIEAALAHVLRGFFGSVPLFKWNRRFKAGSLDDSIRLAFTLAPEAFAKTALTGCTLHIYPFKVEMDLWDAAGDSLNYLEHPLDSIGVDFDAIGEGARRLASAFGLRDATKACWPVLRIDDHTRGFHYLHMDLI